VILFIHIYIHTPALRSNRRLMRRILSSIFSFLQFAKFFSPFFTKNNARRRLFILSPNRVQCCLKHERRLRAFARHQTSTQIEQDDDPIIRSFVARSSKVVVFKTDDIRLRDHASTRMSFAAPTRIRRPLSALLDAVDARLRDAHFKARFRERFSASEEFVQVFRRRERERTRDDRGGSAGENRANRVDDGHARTLLVRAIERFFFSYSYSL